MVDFKYKLNLLGIFTRSGRDRGPYNVYRRDSGCPPFTGRVSIWNSVTIRSGPRVRTGGCVTSEISMDLYKSAFILPVSHSSRRPLHRETKRGLKDSCCRPLVIKISDSLSQLDIVKTRVKSDLTQNKLLKSRLILVCVPQSVQGVSLPTAVNPSQP